MNESLNVPEPVLDRKPGYIELYHVAWKIAYDHIREEEGLPQTPYLDEAHWEDTIWIWDTCFMALFSKYAPETFPGIESLNNFYVPLHTDRYKDGSFLQNIQHPDNPPLFAWVEHDTFLFTNDTAHLDDLLNQTQYLQKHFEWFDTVSPGYRFHSQAKEHNPSAPTRLQKEAKGYRWGGVQSGMDNTPRKGGLWVDAIAQQGLSALYVSRLFDRIGNTQEASSWKTRYEAIRETVNAHYWDPQDGIYYDIDPDSGDFLRVKTPASYWPMLAEMSSPEQAAAMVKHLQDPRVFGGERPWASVARNDPAFVPEHGNYWLGGIWLPLAYMATKALEKYGYHKEASCATERLLTQMANTCEQYEPHTIWECYSPSADEPANQFKHRVRPDFCGWSALGPISMLIENVIGIHTVNASENRVEWRLTEQGRHGIRKLRFGEILTDLIYDGAGQITVESNAPYQLLVNGVAFDIAAGSSKITVKGEKQ